MTRHSWDGTGLYCECCGIEKLGEIRPRENLVLHDRRNRQRHVAVISAKEVVERLAGTTGREAIMRFVEEILT